MTSKICTKSWFRDRDLTFFAKEFSFFVAGRETLEPIHLIKTSPSLSLSLSLSLSPSLSRTNLFHLFWQLVASDVYTWGQRTKWRECETIKVQQRALNHWHAHLTPGHLIKSSSSSAICPFAFMRGLHQLMQKNVTQEMFRKLKGELNPEMKRSQSIELFVTKRLPPIRSLSDVWFSSCASWKSAATPPEFGRDTPFWRHWHSDWPGGDREKVVFRTFRKISAFSSRVVPTGFCRTILRV